MFSVSAGNTLGFIDGMTIDLPTKATLANNFTAILAVQGSTLITGTKIITNNWYYGIAARDGSYIYCPDAQVSNSGDVGIWAFCGSTIVANGAVSNYASDTVNGYGFGFQSEFGSTLVATGAKAMGCYKAGFAALSNSTARIHDCESYLNVGSGFLSWAGGQVEAFGSSSHDNQKYGIEITEYGNIIGVSTNTNNTLGAANKFAYLDTSTGSARVASSGGNLRLDAEGTGGVYFHNSQGLQFGIGNSTSPTSFVEVRGGGVDNGNQPQISASGAATNISIRYDAKGQGSHFFNNNQGLQFGIGNSTSPTSRLEVRGGGVDTNNQPQISATGAATDISIRHDAKGQGSHLFNNGQGLQFGVGNSTSPTSRLEVRGGGVDNNNQPQLSAAGTATDVSIRYDAKGQGSHFFNNGSGLQFQIQSGGVNTINQVYVAGSKTGDPAVVGATGLDPLIDLALLPKGVGSFVRVGAGFFSTPDAPVVGYIQIKDNTGVVRKLAVLA
jgi:hypothetical protein